MTRHPSLPEKIRGAVKLMSTLWDGLDRSAGLGAARFFWFWPSPAIANESAALTIGVLSNKPEFSRKV
jgi:hypothetical protein